MKSKGTFLDFLASEKKMHVVHSLAEAVKFEKSYLVMQGDFGGQIYLTIPAKLIDCSDQGIMRLLEMVDEICWNDIDSAEASFVVNPPKDTIPGGMGGGKLQSGLWVHEDLEKEIGWISDKINGED